MLPEDQPPRTMPYSPRVAKAKTKSRPDVDVPDHELDGPSEKMDRAAEGDDREHGKGGKKGDHGREDEERLVRVGGYDIFLRERLYAVGYGLEEPEGTDPVRPEPYLEPAEHLSLRQGQVGDEAHEDRDDDDALDEGFYEKEERLHHFTLSAPVLRSTSPGVAEKPSTSRRSLKTRYSSTPGLKPSFMESGLYSDAASRRDLDHVALGKTQAAASARRHEELILGDRVARLR